MAKSFVSYYVRWPNCLFSLTNVQHASSLGTTIGNQVLAKCIKTLNGTPWNSGGKKQCISAFHKKLHGELELDIDNYAIKKIDRPRRTHNQQYQTNSKFISTSQFSTSFFLSTISSWNKLPQSLVDIIDPDIFKTSLVEMGQQETLTV